MKFGFVCGAFDLLHPGHVLLLSECRKHCDALIVGLHTDPTIDRPGKNKPIQSTYERYMQLAFHKSVYHIIPYDTEADLYNLLATQELHVRFLGSEYQDTQFTGKGLCIVRDIEIIYIDRFHDWSSSQLRARL